MKKAMLLHPDHHEEYKIKMELGLKSETASKNYLSYMEDRDPLDDYRFAIVNGNIAVIPVYGYITHRYGFWTWFFGGTSCYELMNVIAKLLDIEKIEKIVLDVNSPGGTVSGVEQVSQFIYEARDKKPIIAYVDTLAASAAYWIASACKRVYVSESSAEVGSIGVYLLHMSYEGYLEKEGVKATHIHAGDKKTLGTPYRDLAEEDVEIMQEDVDAIYDLFSSAVALYRGITKQSIDSMEALTFMPKKAKKLGLIDGQFSLNELYKALENDDEEANEEEEETQDEDDDVEAADAQDDNDEENAQDEEEEEEEESQDEEDEEKAKKKGRKMSTKQAIRLGQKLEAKRRQAIKDLTVPGMEKFMQKYIDDGTSPEKAMVLQTKALKKKGGMKYLSSKYPGVETTKNEGNLQGSNDKKINHKTIGKYIPEKYKKEGHAKIGERLSKV